MVRTDGVYGKRFHDAPRRFDKKKPKRPRIHPQKVSDQKFNEWWCFLFFESCVFRKMKSDNDREISQKFGSIATPPSPLHYVRML